MSDEVRAILDAALALPEAERSRLVVLLCDSLGDDGSRADLDEVVLAEVKRRLAELDSGQTQTISYDEIKRRLRTTVERARGSQSSSG